MDLELSLNLATSLGIGLLIGAERAWRARDDADSEQMAGIRTFGLTGLLGGLAALSQNYFGVWAWLATLVLVALLVIVAYVVEVKRTGDHGMTSEVALLLTFLLGSLALVESRLLAAACAIVVALLLNLKTRLHSLLHQLTEAELGGALKLLFISVVLLPNLPNQGYGPWEAFNPYTTWWMVVLIAGIGFAAYAAVRLLGAHHGLVLTAVLGGMVSSTAMTVTLARLDAPAIRSALAAGLLATSALMFPRVLIEVALVNPVLLPALLAPLLAACAVYTGGALYYYRHATQQPEAAGPPPLKNPFELGPALRFAALLVLILFLVEGARRWLGDVGVYLVALLSGLTDVDAITLSLANSAQNELSEMVAARGIFLAAFGNSVVKAGLIGMIGGRTLALQTIPVMAAGLLLGLAVLLVA
ncbi:MAG: MgtC/SapB family protein [Xanthomonadaceae bacterium]|nr:MgtC/SapB family protein [Xanthomonadaceae bacterium]